MRFLVLWFLTCIPFAVYSQSSETVNNPRYFEDQFYAGITYNFILNKPTGVNQRNLSYGLQTGFIKDLPFNTDRTFGLGIGFGFGLYSYYTNMRAIDNGSVIEYELIEGVEDFKRSKIENFLIEIPIEFRWRNSDVSTYNFWRIYSGVKFGYALNSRSKYVETQKKGAFDNIDIRNLQYGITLNVGFHNFNVHTYYSLSNLFNDGVNIGSEEINISPLRVGLILYIL